VEAATTTIIKIEDKPYMTSTVVSGTMIPDATMGNVLLTEDAATVVAGNKATTLKMFVQPPWSNTALVVIEALSVVVDNKTTPLQLLNTTMMTNMKNLSTPSSLKRYHLLCYLLVVVGSYGRW
jgi:hypothetical protein